MVKIKQFVLFITLLTMLSSLAVGAYSRQNYYFVDENGLDRTDLSYVYVYNAGTITASTLYQTSTRETAITNPMTPSSTNTTLSQDLASCWFYDDNKSHDVIVHVGGRELKYYNVGGSSDQHTFVVPRYLRNGSIRKKGFFDNFSSQPLCAKKLGAGAATGTAGDENMLYTGQNLLEYHILGTQTIVAPDRLATGLDIGGMDQTANDGIELCPGILSGNNSAFTVGTDGPFHFKVKMSIADVTGTDELAIGFRKAEAYQANVDDYDEMAALNVISGNITIETIKNAAATTSTDTTDDWADAGIHQLEVYVSKAGVVTYKIDGSAPTVTAAFSFDSGEVVVPFLYFLQDTDIAGDTIVMEWDCGLDE